MDTKAVVNTEDGTNPVETNTSAETAITQNWDSDDNPYRDKATRLEQQFSGLQGNFKQLLDDHKQTRVQQAALLEELAAAKALADGKTPEEAEAVKQVVRGNVNTANKTDELTYREREIANAQNQLSLLAKPIIIAEIAKKHGVDPAMLMECENGPEAERMAANIAKLTRKAVLDDRKKDKVDAGEGGGSGSLDWSKLSSYEKLSRKVKNAKNER